MTNFFDTIISDVEGFFDDDVLPEAQAFFASLVRSVVAGGGAVLIQAATGAVAAAEAQGGTGSQKFAAAQASVISTLTTQGVPVVENAINAAIEAAVAQSQVANGTAPDLPAATAPATAQAATQS